MLVPELPTASSVTSSLGKGTLFLHLWNTAISACTGQLSKRHRAVCATGNLTVGLVIPSQRISLKDGTLQAGPHYREDQLPMAESLKDA